MSRILIVEDNPVNLKLARVILEDAGFETLSAINAEEADQLLLLWRPDAILMDVGLPGKDGYAYTRELRQRAETADLPIVALTSFAMKGDRDKALEAGCTAYLTKPLNRVALVEVLRTMVSLSSRVSEPGILMTVARSEERNG